jgi:hypothetical protein
MVVNYLNISTADNAPNIPARTPGDREAQSIRIEPIEEDGLDPRVGRNDDRAGQLPESLRRETDPFNVRSNAVAKGWDSA